MRKQLPFRLKLDSFLLIVYLAVSGILLAFSSGGFVVNFRTIGFSLMSGAQKGVYSVSAFFSGTVTAIGELSKLRHDYDELTKRLEDYEILQRSNVDIQSENLRLRELLGYSQTLTLRNIPAEIIGHDPNNLYSGITINRGAKHGIRKDMPVIAFQGNESALVGKIAQVGRLTSLVMPIYDYQCYVSGRLETSRYDGLVNGQGSPDEPVVMKYVKKRAKDEIYVGERVVTSGENLHYPKNALIGFVSKIRGLDYETSIELDVEPAIDFSRLENVFVLDMDSETGVGN